MRCECMIALLSEHIHAIAEQTHAAEIGSTLECSNVSALVSYRIAVDSREAFQ